MKWRRMPALVVATCLIYGAACNSSSTSPQASAPGPKLYERPVPAAPGGAKPPANKAKSID